MRSHSTFVLTQRRLAVAAVASQLCEHSIHNNPTLYLCVPFLQRLAASPLRAAAPFRRSARQTVPCRVTGGKRESLRVLVAVTRLDTWWTSHHNSGGCSGKYGSRHGDVSAW